MLEWRNVTRAPAGRSVGGAAADAAHAARASTRWGRGRTQRAPPTSPLPSQLSDDQRAALTSNELRQRCIRATRQRHLLYALYILYITFIHRYTSGLRSTHTRLARHTPRRGERPPPLSIGSIAPPLLREETGALAAWREGMGWGGGAYIHCA
jgi:hypothetical protein